MKKYIILIISFLLLCGCSRNKSLNIDTFITSIVYDNMQIVNSDYKTIINEINNKTFYKLSDDTIKGKNLEIKTSEYLYKFEIVDNYIIYTVDKDRYFYKTNDLNSKLNTIVNKYMDESFYTVDIINNYNSNESDYLVKIDNSNSYIIINSNLNIYNFKVNKVEKNKEEYVDVDLLNSIDMVESNKKICIRTNTPKQIKISFNTPYNYKVTLLYENGFIKKIDPK